MADAKHIFQQKYKCYQSTLKKVSYDKNNQESLCQNETLCVYDFDKITQKEHSSNQFSSCDSLSIDEGNKKIYCIEFKNSKYSDVKTADMKKK